ncbi:creatininase family protein [Aeropyrum camini]|uniref:Putative amidase n=1 Tax=Aeropyrum camini SY1 = JCM 12091 TaxID=1198449 RepID=U3TFJ3_9CREN|nr:creatininase family protein [Aeropyrum camini]BAN90094.1 putative amidase [Aeropyrum camini SY1 = JCM 12091]
MPLDLVRISSFQAAELPGRTLPVIPVGSVEQHCNLPLGTDAILAEAAARGACELLEREHGITCLLLPTLYYGFSPEWSGYPGTISLSLSTLHSILFDLLSSLKGWGFERAAVVNGHGGNTSVLEAAAREASRRLSMVVGVANYWAFLPGRELGHGGEAEASLLQHLAGAVPSQGGVEKCRRVRTSRWGGWIASPGAGGGVGAYAQGSGPVTLSGVEEMLRGLSRFLYDVWRQPVEEQSI